MELPSGLSPSKVSSFKDCALAFKFGVIDRLPEPPSPWTAKGTLVHRALERLFCEAQADRTLEAALFHLDQARPEVMEHWEYADLELSEDETVEFFADAETLVRNYFLLEDPTRIHAIGLELRLDVELGSLHLRGIIDRLDLDDDGELTVVDYKGLAIDTPLPTPTGWTTMGAVEVGDLLLGADGMPTKVLEKSAVHSRRCFEIKFDDSTSIVCDNEHLWSVRIGEVPHVQTKVLSADELHDLWRSGVHPITIPNTAPLQLQPSELPIDPYVLGVWLGDGNSRKGIVHSGAEDVDYFVTALASRGERVIDSTSPSSRRRNVHELWLGKPVPELCVRGHSARRGNRPDGRKGDCAECLGRAREFPSNGTLSARLSAIGLIGRHRRTPRGRLMPRPAKSVPDAYLRAHVDQRLDLLRGLMDTDGYWHPRRRQAVFTTTSARLANAVEDLVCGLGARAYTYSERYDVASGPRTKYQVIFTPAGFNPFSLPRKATACVVNAAGRRSNRRAIKAIAEVPSVPTQCVLVDASDSLYLAGHQMVPTHNTGRAPSVNYENTRLGGVQFYSFMCEELFGKRPKHVQLLHLKEPVAIISTPSDQSTSAFQRKVTALWAAVERACERDDFRPRPSGLCDYCAYKPYCPAWGGDPALAAELAATAASNMAFAPG